MRLFILTIIILLSPVLQAATNTAASTSRTDVNTAYTTCSDGDTLVIPAGTSTYSSPIDIGKAITIIGNGTNSTILKSNSGNAVFRIYKVGSTSHNVRITEIGLDGNHQDTSNQGILQIGTSSSTTACDNVYDVRDFRVDHCRFYNVGDNDLVGGLTGYPAIMISGYTYGVLDHNTFDNCYGECLDIGADGTGNNTSSPVSLSRSLAYGGYTNGVIYIEDNVWNYNLAISPGDYGAENAIDGNSGSRWVMRHNTFNIASNTLVQALISNHETCAPRSCDGASQGDVGSLMMEIYSNVVSNNGTAPNFGVGTFITQRGGRMLCYSNSIFGHDTENTSLIRLSNFRSYHRLGCGAVAARGYAEVAHETTAGKTSEGLDAAKTTLNGGINNSVQTITLTLSSGFDVAGLANGFSIRIGTEQIDYTGISGNNLTGCTRGVNGTSAASHSNGANVDYLKFGVAIEQINNTFSWQNKSLASNKNACEVGGDLTAPDYSFYDIESFAQRSANYQFRDDNTAYSYTAYAYPHPLVSGLITYYVATNGNNSNDGLTVSTPWTLTKGLTNLGPDITIIMLPGTYTGDATIAAAASGMAGHPATLQSQTKWSAVIANGTNWNLACSFTPFVSYLVVDGIVSSNCTAGDGIGLAANNCTIKNCWIVNNNQQGINASHASSSNNIIDSNLIEGNGAAGGTTNLHFHGIYLSGPNNIARNNVIRRDYGFGLHYYTGFTNTIQDNTAIYNNLIYGHTNIYGLTVWGTDGGLTLSGTNQVINNTILDGASVYYGTARFTNNIIVPSVIYTNAGIAVGSGPPTITADYNMSTVAFASPGAHDVITNYMGFASTNAGLYWLAADSPARTKAIAETLAVDFFSVPNPTITDIGFVQYTSALAGDGRTLDPSGSNPDYWGTPTTNSVTFNRSAPGLRARRGK